MRHGDYTGEYRVKRHPDRGPLRRKAGVYTEAYNSRLALWVPVRRLSTSEEKTFDEGKPIIIFGENHV